jgi:molybdenum-dependent DNA-binding transcriptional regulator ModE
VTDVTSCDAHRGNRTNRLESLAKIGTWTDPSRGAINPARFDLVSLRLVVLCAELGSLSAAARFAHLSISGASSRLTRLEQTFKTELFRRHWRGLTPTKEGAIVATQAARMLHLAQEMNDSLIQVKTAAGHA